MLPHSALPCSSGPYATVGPIAITLWRTPTKLTGNLALPLLDTPFEAIWVIFITYNEMSTVLHHIGFIVKEGGGARSPAARHQQWQQRSGKRGGSAAAAAAAAVAVLAAVAAAAWRQRGGGQRGGSAAAVAAVACWQWQRFSLRRRCRALLRW
jgi:hypothetical protein